MNRRDLLCRAGGLAAFSALGPLGCASAPAPRKPTVGLALGGGAARGFAHIGVIKVLESAGIVPDLIVGTSAGSVVGVLYASGMNAFELQRAALQLEESTLSDWTIGNRGVIRGEALAQYVNRQVQGRTLEKLPRSIAVVATDVRSGEPVVFQRGDSGTAVRASSAVPGIFTPVKIAEREFVDGGLSHPVPAAVARRLGADIVIAVDISARPRNQELSGTIDVLLQTFTIMGSRIAETELKQADVVIRPDLAGIKGTDFASRNIAILEGERAAQAALAEIRKRIDGPLSVSRK